MNLRPSGASVLSAALLALCTFTSVYAGAQLEPLRTVADYLAAFNDAYEPDLYQATRLSEAEAAVTRASQTMLPDVTLEQSLDWSAFHQVHLDLETGLRLPLYDSRAVPEVALAGADHEAAQAAAAAARTAARLSYFVDVATYAVLVETSDAVAVVLDQFGALPWLDQPGFDPRKLAPEDRGLYEAHQRLLDMQSFLLDQREVVSLRIARAVNRAPALLVAPSWAELLSGVPRPPEHRVCLASSPAVSAAHLRHRQALLYEALAATVPVTVDLRGDLALGLLGPGPAGSTVFQFNPAATLALEARLALPSGRSVWQDVDGALAASVSPTGASQSLRISWPRPTQPAATTTDPAADLAAELDAAEANLSAVRRALAQATTERSRLERAWDWLLLDNLGFDSGRGPGAAPPAVALTELSRTASLDLVAHAADLSAQVGFARLDEVIAQAQLASDCGAWP